MQSKYKRNTYVISQISIKTYDMVILSYLYGKV